MVPDLTKLHLQICRFLPSVNQLLLKDYQTGTPLFFKQTGFSSTSIVTQTDKTAEKLIKKQLKRIFPQAGFIGEETASQVKDYNWIIDPIDGTLNFANHVPIFAVSIALWHQNQPLYGLASYPLFNETVHAVHQQGIYLNNKRVKPADITPKRFFLVYSVVGNQQLRQNVYKVFTQVCRSPRNFGSCVFHGANTALRRFDAAVMVNQAIWDIGAIALMAQEAGLDCQYISSQPDIHGKKLKDYQYSLVIATKTTAKKLAGEIKALIK